MQTISEKPVVALVAAWTGRKTQEPASQLDRDLLVADALNNMSRSHLCGLPDIVLLRIMKLLDPTDLQCLRRTSRVFLRLFSSRVFRSYHDSSPVNLSWQPFFPWTIPRQGFEFWTPELRRLLQRDATNKLCADCQDGATRWEWHWNLSFKKLTTTHKHCSGCGVKHPLAYFSRAQRSHVGARCIGQRGYVRLCEHRVLRWKTVAGIGKQLAKLDTRKPIRIRLLECRDPSHLPAHHDIVPEMGYPSATIEGSSTTAIRLVMEWSGHLLIPERSGDSKGRRFTPGEITDLLKEFRQGVAEFIVPQSAPGSLPEMRCFDPNRCRCLHYVAFKDVPWSGWQLARPAMNSSHQSCRTDARCRLPPLSPPFGGTSVKQGADRKTGSHISRTILGHLSGTRIDINHCVGGGLCLDMTYRRFILLAARGEACHVVTPSWYESVDPASYRLVDGTKAYDGLSCRDDPECASYYRYLERPIPRQCRGSHGVGWLHADIRPSSSPSDWWEERCDSSVISGEPEARFGRFQAFVDWLQLFSPSLGWALFAAMMLPHVLPLFYVILAPLQGLLLSPVVTGWRLIG
ncbi:hypothetical protein QBC46DRAFT_297878 [Diplogelasinospora grovesii]|uniref:F-box domain-containing protein n=1 Tax=Diplogelasinospora grovesii TaxID=303347 RepID=A0AAN6MZR8_9PEZI|nr:hypothetical protein QBC46DRAFT_297878 [Diplogelasinospora grovesii]